MSEAETIVRRHWRRNWLAFFTDYVGFGLGLTLASTTTTLPAFAATLTDNKILIGAVSSVWAGGWLLPQVLAANYLTNKPRKYPIMMLWQIIGRPILPLFVVWLLLGGTRWSELTLAFLLFSLGYFAATDALVALAWLDLFGKAIPANRRGRLVGIGQVVTGVGAIGAGVVIQHVLGPNGPAYPVNYAVIFGLASVFYAISSIANALIVEPPEAVATTRPQLKDFLPELVRLLSSNRAFSQVTAVRLLSGTGTLATTFYVVYATEGLRLSPATVGWFAAAMTFGVALAGLVLGVIADRSGTHRVVQIMTWAQFAAPALALLVHAGLFGSATAYVYPLLFVLLGIFEGSLIMGFINYVLELAPPGQRPTYLGLINTLVGCLTFMPALGGLLLQWTSFATLFALTATGTLLGALLALRLPNPRVLPAVPPAPHSDPQTQPAP